MSRILVLGGEGMLGHKMVQTLSERFPQTICTIFGSLSDDLYSRVELFRQVPVVEHVNAMDLDSLDKTLAHYQPEFIINCIGIIKQRDEAHSAVPSITLNSLLPHRLAAASAKWGGRVIHFSTDCVFSGRRGSYTEDDPSDAEDLYGRSKFLGEVAVGNALTLRTSIIGRELSHFKSLLEWFLAQRGKTVSGFTKVLYSGVTTNLLAQVVANVIEEHPDLSGLYQVTSNTISKHDLLSLLRDAYKLDCEIAPDDNEVSDRSMLGGKFRAAAGYVCPPWPELVTQLASDPTPYESWR